MRTSFIVALTTMILTACSGAQSLPQSPDKISFPHLIVKIDEASPDKAYGTGYNGTVSPTISSIFNFDQPPTGLSADKQQRCELVFFFPEASSLREKSYEFNAKGGLIFYRLRREATAKTTFDNQTRERQVVRYIRDLAPGNRYSLQSDRCVEFAGVGYKMAAIGNTYLDFFQTYSLDELRGPRTDNDVNGKRFDPLGLFVIAFGD
ncbi:MAG: hypothetical protein Q9220_001879 [cf. Caloplaca sp. 1 TL-2023]